MRRPGLVLVLVGSALVLAAVLGAILLGNPAPADELPVPPDLAGLPLVEAKKGESAVAEIQRMHGETFALASAAFVRYGAAGQATLWIAGATTEDEAAAMVEAMHNQIAAGGSPFTPLAPTAIDGVTVYPLLGLGQEHMYFRSGSSVVWLAVDADIAEGARRAVVEAYR